MGIRRSLVPLLPHTEIRGPRSVHQSNQKLTDFPSPKLHLIKAFSFGFSFSIWLTVDEKVVEVSAVQKDDPAKTLCWSQATHKELASEKKFQTLFSWKTDWKSSNFLIPNPPSFFGLHISSQLTRAPEADVVLFFQRKDAQKESTLA